MYYYNKQDIETLEILKKHLNYIMYYYNHGGIKTEYEKDSNLNYIMYYYNAIIAGSILKVLAI